jgi:hypothetical protein
MLRRPVVVPAGGWPGGTTLDPAKPPDVRFRIAVLRDERADRGIDAPVQPALPAWDAGRPLATYAGVASAHAQSLLDLTDAVRLLVFRSNLGLLSFRATAAGEHAVTHALLSPVGDGTSGADVTHHEVDLDRAAALAAPALAAG